MFAFIVEVIWGFSVIGTVFLGINSTRRPSYKLKSLDQKTIKNQTSIDISNQSFQTPFLTNIEVSH